MLHHPVRAPFLLSPSTNVFCRDSADYLYSRDTSSFPPSIKRFPIDPFPRSAFSGFHSPPVPVLPSCTPPMLPIELSSPSLPRFPLPAKQASPHSPILPQHFSSHSSLVSSTIDDVFCSGDFVGEGCLLQGEPIRLVSLGISPPSDGVQPATEFQVKRALGHGSYAVVYLVQEVLSRPPPQDCHMSTIGVMDLDGSSSSEVCYGREYAIKCLSKANLDEVELAAQMSEVTIHQSLRPHPNIVTLHRTLETSSHLLLLLEYVPGEDLFYFLEQARDHYDDSHRFSDFPISRTPPTPSLLSNIHPSQFLSRNRLRLISSMFSQMCDAVAACHSQQVFHRDIKPENFIVTDGWITLPDGRLERKVLVKLSDFGLSTTEISSADMDCGSAPYMSYECRNNIAPTYCPRAADVWSLGIVLINMLYHFNPWTDTAQGICSSFDVFRKEPVNFFMQRFSGMTRTVAEYLTTQVFCILDDPVDDSQRSTAQEFGTWARNLPTLLSSHAMHRTVSNSSQGHPIATSTPLSHRPSSRQASTSTSAVRTPAMPTRSLSRAPSLGPSYEGPESSELSTVLDHELITKETEEGGNQIEIFTSQESMQFTSTLTKKRWEGDVQKDKAESSMTSSEDTLATLGIASQLLARETSKVSRSSSILSNGARRPLSFVPSVSSESGVKKPSKWRLSFGKSSASTASVAAGRISPVEEAPSPSEDSNFTYSITGRVANLNTESDCSLITSSANFNTRQLPMGRNHRKGRLTSQRNNSNHSLVPVLSRSPEPGSTSSHRPVSPNSYRNGRLASSSSNVSNNWRNSSSSSRTSTSAFTRYSNSSVRSLATTSVSSMSWRTNTKSSPSSCKSSLTAAPQNVKVINGVPWELGQSPRGQHLYLAREISGSPSLRKNRINVKDGKLDTIKERPSGNAKLSESHASISTTDVTSLGNEVEGVKKVQKGQINALAKMLSALRR